MSKLPNMEHRFKIQVTGSETKTLFTGDFLYRRPTLRERAMIEVMQARLNGDMQNIDVDIRAYNEAISYLRFTLKEFPDWWKDSGFGGDIWDSNVVIEIYNKCMEFEANWNKRVYGEVQESDLDAQGSGADQ